MEATEFGVALDARSALESWGQVSRALLENLPLSETLDLIAHIARDLTGNPYAMIALVDDRHERLVVRGSAGLSEEYLVIANDEYPLLIQETGSRDEYPSSQAFRTGAPAIVLEPYADDRFAGFREAGEHEGHRAILSVPLAGPGELGVLTVYSASPSEFSESEVALLLALAGGAATAIEIVRLRDREQSMMAELEQVDRMHQTLTSVALLDQGLDPIVRTLSEMTDYDMIVTDAASEAVVTVSPAGSQGPALADGVRQKLIHRALARKSATPEACSVAQNKTVYLVPIMLAGDIAAYLWAWASAMPMTNTQERVLERGAMVIALELLKQRHAREIEWRMRGDVLADLLSLEPADEPRMLARASAYGHDLTKPHVVLVVRPDAAQLDACGPLPSTSEAAQQLVISCTRAVISGAPPQPLVASRSSAVVVLWPITSDAPRSPIQIAHAIQRYVSGRSGGSVTASVAIGDRCETPMEYRTATRLALGALRIVQEAGAKSRIVMVEELGIYRLLLSVDNPAMLRTFGDRILGPLRQHDESRGAELLMTLRAYLENDLHNNRTATELHIHANSLAYRLQRIESLTGVNIRSSGGLLEVSFALAIDRLLAPSHLN